MPGSGKSTVGRQLARKLGVGFVDCDQVIEMRIGCPIKDFFASSGEAAFRDIETQVIDDMTRTACGVLLPKLISGQLDVEDIDIDVGMTVEELTEAAAG